MKNWLIALAAVAAIAVTGAASAQGDAAAGKQKAAVCSACHGPDGNSVNPEWPSLAGLGERYIVAQLTAFKNGGRSNPLMTPQAQALSEQDIRDLAAYFASQTMKPGEADPSLVKAGEQIYLGGIGAKGVPACAACHGPTGAGNPQSAYPRIGGQQAVYLALQLQAYRSGARATDPNNMMRDIASKLSDDEIKAVAAYASGLYRRQ
jgi:Cytochrome c553